MVAPVLVGDPVERVVAVGRVIGINPVLAFRPVTGTPCHYQVGLPAHVTQFLARLKQAVAANDRSTVAAMVNYPLTVYSSGGRSMTYRDAAAQRANYAHASHLDRRAARRVRT